MTAEGSACSARVKSVRAGKYVFMRKRVFSPRANLFLVLAIFVDGEFPELFLVPSTVWLSPNALFVSKDYEGKKSAPEWGVQLSKKNRPLLEPFRFAEVAMSLRSG